MPRACSEVGGVSSWPTTGGEERGSKGLSRLWGHTSLNHAAHADGCCTVLKSVNASVALDRRGSTIPTGESNLLRSLEEDQHVGTTVWCMYVTATMQKINYVEVCNKRLRVSATRY